MPTNTGYGFPYPTSNEPVANGAANIQSLASTVDSKMGLHKIAAASFSGITNAAPLDVNGVFSSLFSNYKLFIRYSQASATGNSFIRMRTATTVEAGSVYNYSTYGQWVTPTPTFMFGGYATTNPFSPDAAFYIGVVGAPYMNTGEWDIFSPNLARGTRFSGSWYTEYSGTNYNTAMQSLGEVATNTQYTGFRLYPTAGSISGEYWLYGYRN